MPDEDFKRRIRELKSYDDEDDRDSSVNIVAQPGSTVRVSTHDGDSDPPIIKKTKWARWAKIAGALIGIVAGTAKVIWDATH